MEQDWTLNSTSPTPCRAVGCLFSPNTPPKPPETRPRCSAAPSAPGASLSLSLPLSPGRFSRPPCQALPCPSPPGRAPGRPPRSQPHASGLPTAGRAPASPPKKPSSPPRRWQHGGRRRRPCPALPSHDGAVMWRGAG